MITQKRRRDKRSFSSLLGQKGRRELLSSKQQIRVLALAKIQLEQYFREKHSGIREIASALEELRRKELLRMNQSRIHDFVK